MENVILTPDGQEIPDPTPVEEVTDDTAVEEEPAEYTPRDDFIDRIIALGQEKYEEAGGRAQRAHYAEDIYVCKNFTVYLFRQNRDDFRMAEYPDTTLVIPNNLRQRNASLTAMVWRGRTSPPRKGILSTRRPLFATILSSAKRKTWNWRWNSCVR